MTIACSASSLNATYSLIQLGDGSWTIKNVHGYNVWFHVACDVCDAIEAAESDGFEFASLDSAFLEQLFQQ